jgi:molecular chaperone GrpE (heat shock protein)
MPRYRIPVRVVSPPAPDHLAPARPRVRSQEDASDSRVGPARDGHVREPAPQLSEERGNADGFRVSGQGPGTVGPVMRASASTRAPDPAQLSSRKSDAAGSEPCSDVEWRERALRLQAEMENYRKRQQRVAQEQARGAQERLLLDVLTIADNLDRTLSATQHPVSRDSEPIRQGVVLTRDELDRLLSRYDVERIAALHQPFDPRWHEALGVTSAAKLGVEADTVVEVLQAGYRRGERLLRPAGVVVAQ